MDEIREYERTSTTVVNAYPGPITVTRPHLQVGYRPLRRSERSNYRTSGCAALLDPRWRDFRLAGFGNSRNLSPTAVWKQSCFPSRRRGKVSFNHAAIGQMSKANLVDWNLVEQVEKPDAIPESTSAALF